MEHTTPRNFALQLGALAALYVSLTALTLLLFGAITLTIPDASDSIWTLNNAAQQIRISIAMLIVFFPTYLILTRNVNVIRRQSNDSYLGITRWLIYISLLIGGAVLLADGVALIYSFLEDDTTFRFLIKAVVLAIVTGAAFTYYLLDARGYWLRNEKKSLTYGAVVIVAVIGALVWGLYNIEPPAVVREMKIDSNQVGDLQDMQWRIEDYYRSRESLPPTISELYLNEAPTAPDTRDPYQYTITGTTTYQLCATFATASQNDNDTMVRPMGLAKNDVWEHPASNWCFEREIDQMYRQ